MTLQPGIDIDDVSEDHYLPRHRWKFLRACNRLLRNFQVAELGDAVRSRLTAAQWHVLMVYKGNGVPATLLKEAKAAGLLTVNVFPDCSPHAHGRSLREAMGEYDLVISTKPFHPENWAAIYGYANRCVFVPHGYDPAVHVWDSLPRNQDLDVVLAASWRPEYDDLVRGIADRARMLGLRVGLAGSGWRERRADYPTNWAYGGVPTGRAYAEWLRRGKIVIAPVQRRMRVAGKIQPGDEDSTRTYELAAAHCFFVHRRTEYVQTVYNEHTEVPMWTTPTELVDLLQHYLPRDQERRAMASAAHARAVPAYSISQRAPAIIGHIREALSTRAGSNR